MTYVNIDGTLRIAGESLESHWATAHYEERDGYIIRVALEEHDQEYANPRGDCNLGTMICDYRGYTLGDGTPQEVTGRSQNEFKSLEQHVRWLHLALGATVVLPLYLLDHSGISMSAGGSLKARMMQEAHMGWDTSMVGFIYDTPKGRENCGTPADLIEKVLRQEVECYDTYLRGEVYFWEVIEAETGDTVESCGGYLGGDGVIEDMVSDASNSIPDKEST